MAEMLEALARTGQDVRVLVPRTRGLEEGRRNGVDVVGVPYAPPQLQVWGYGRSLKSDGKIRAASLAITPFAVGLIGRALRSQLRLWQPDLVHLHWLLPLGALAPLVPSRTPVVISLHGADAKFALGPLAPLARESIRRSDAVVAASSGILRALESIEPGLPLKARVIPHGANREVFSRGDRAKARIELQLDQDARIVFAVGRLVDKKGFHHLVDASRLYTDERTTTWIAGTGPAEGELRHQIEGSDAHVTMLGRLDRDEVARWMEAANLVVVPSVPKGNDIDSGPVVLMEALASGRPVVSTPIGMAPDLIIDGVNGFLVPPGDHRALATAIRNALADGGRLAEQARRTFERVGDWNRVAQDLRSLYEELIKTG